MQRRVLPASVRAWLAAKQALNAIFAFFIKKASSGFFQLLKTGTNVGLS